MKVKEDVERKGLVERVMLIEGSGEGTASGIRPLKIGKAKRWESRRIGLMVHRSWLSEPNGKTILFALVTCPFTERCKSCFQGFQ